MKRYYYHKRKKRRYNRKLKNLKRNEQIRVNNERANDVNVIDDSREVFTPDDYDAHCCSAYDDGNGYCTFCGAVIPGTFAYAEVYGGEPREIPRYHWSDL